MKTLLLYKSRVCGGPNKIGLLIRLTGSREMDYCVFNSSIKRKQY